jgi:hypothetical protein
MYLARLGDGGDDSGIDTSSLPDISGITSSINPAVLVGAGFLFVIAYALGTGRSTRVEKRHKRYRKLAKKAASWGF